MLRGGGGGGLVRAARREGRYKRSICRTAAAAPPALPATTAPAHRSSARAPPSTAPIGSPCVPTLRAGLGGRPGPAGRDGLRLSARAGRRHQP